MIEDMLWTKNLIKKDDFENRHIRLKILQEKGFKLQIFNGGNQIKINRIVDWYPTTARWVSKTEKGHGFKSLLEFLDNYKPVEIKEMAA